MYLLDTGVVAELRHSGPAGADRNVIAWAAAQPPSTLFLSAISVLELETGVLSLMRQDGGQGAALRSWLNDQVLKAFAGRILPVDIAVAQRCARLRVSLAQPERTCLLASTALVHGLALVTPDAADFAGTGVAVVNPWQPAS